MFELFALLAARLPLYDDQQVPGPGVWGTAEVVALCIVAGVVVLALIGSWFAMRRVSRRRQAGGMEEPVARAA